VETPITAPGGRDGIPIVTCESPGLDLAFIPLAQKSFDRQCGSILGTGEGNPNYAGFNCGSYKGEL
jgi:hypothetical protein